MKPRNLIIVSFFINALLFGSQFIFPVPVTMRGDLAYAKTDQRNDAGPKEKAAPPASGCDGTPSRYPAHDDAPHNADRSNGETFMTLTPQKIST
jgi:hypothetical protein